jgi:hypothetical protein
MLKKLLYRKVTLPKRIPAWVKVDLSDIGQIGESFKGML